MIGLCSVTFRDKSVEEIIALVKEADLEVIEWGSDAHVPETDVEQAKAVAKQMEEAGLKSNSYGTYYRLGTFEDFEPYLEVAKVLGASLLRVWAGEAGSEETLLEDRKKVAEDAHRIGALAAEEGLKIGLEYHQKTLTDTPDSALQLMEEIDSPHVLLYWQPAENLTVAQRIESLPRLAPYISTVHVFNWENYQNRFPLADAAEDWKQYLAIIQEHSSHDPNFLLEFVPGEDPVQGFFESAKTLKKLIK